MNIYIKELFETIDFNNTDIFNREDSYYEYNEKDALIYRTIEDKIFNNRSITEEESIYYFNFNNEISDFILNILLNAEKNSDELIKGILKNNVKKYKVSSKKELIKIIEDYSEKNPTGSLNWIDVSNITDMSWLFAYTDYNGDISEWDISNVTNMESMFGEAKSFNQPIGDWDVSNVRNMSFMFSGAYSFNQPIGDWDVSKVKDMNFMFHKTKSFNQPIGEWNVSNVTNMIEMFSDAVTFNQDISHWKLNKLKYAYNIFCKCPIKKEYKPKIKV